MFEYINTLYFQIKLLKNVSRKKEKFWTKNNYYYNNIIIVKFKDNHKIKSSDKNVIYILTKILYLILLCAQVNIRN